MMHKFDRMKPGARHRVIVFVARTSFCKITTDFYEPVPCLQVWALKMPTKRRVQEAVAMTVNCVQPQLRGIETDQFRRQNFNSRRYQTGFGSDVVRAIVSIGIQKFAASDMMLILEKPAWDLIEAIDVRTHRTIGPGTPHAIEPIFSLRH